MNTLDKESEAGEEAVGVEAIINAQATGEASPRVGFSGGYVRP